MNVIVLTGGIATGKSTVLARLKEWGHGILDFYDCDAEVARILSSGCLSAELIEAFGPGSVNERGEANKPYLREIVFKDSDRRKELERLIHPILEQECLAQVAQARQNPIVRGLIVDVPLYYETGFSCGEDAVCVVAVSSETQRARLADRNHFDDELMDSIIASQLPISDKVGLADIVLWNEGPVAILEKQAKRFFRHYFS